VPRPSDIAVIGGGIVGTATAAFLAQAGASVVLYEREALAAGASGRNSGVIQHPFDPALVPLYEETLEIYRRIGEAVGRPIAALDAPPDGLLLVSHDRAGVLTLATELGRAFPALRPDFVEGPVLAALEPTLAPDIVACRLDIGYPIIPSAPTYAFATLAERAGVSIRLGREAHPVVEAGRCVGVEVAGRLEPAGAVVVAAGPWTGALIEPTGAWNPIRPVWGVVVETLLANPPRHVMEEAEMDEALGSGDPSKARDSAAAADERPEFSLITAAGASAVGSTFLETEPDPPAWTERLLAHATTFVPGIMDAPIREVRACARPMSRDGRPIVGAIAWMEGLFVASGHGPWGISTGPASARQISDLVLGREAGIDGAFAPARFAAPTSAEVPS
jgi:glycine/D-amino acid oxidase-like deaminating enzyme